MNTAVALVLNRVLGEWLEGIDSSSFNLSLMSGEVRLGPIQVKPDAINRLGFPFTLRCGFVDKIVVKVPVFSLGSKQMVIEIDGVYIYASPRGKDDWNPETEISNQKKAKQAQLDGFELMNKEQLPQDPGFTGRLVGKIIDNLQINISGVYFRYVDHISSSSPFALGIVLKNMELFTCNEQWEMEFREDSKLTLKKIKIENLAVFLDYGTQCDVDLPVSPGFTEKQSFEQYARNEVSMTSTVRHKYLVHPLFLEVRAKLSKDASNKELPQVEAKVDLGKRDFPFRFGFEAPQVTHLMKCGAFFGEFKTFQTGVLVSIHGEEPFTEEEGKLYREVYIKWRTFVLADKAKKAQTFVPELESFESLHPFEEIAKQRKAAIQDFELQEAENTLKSQLSQLEAPVAEGKVSRLKGYVGWGPSDDDKKKKEEERQREREKTEAALQLAREKRAKFQQEITGFVSDDTPLLAPVVDNTYNSMKIYLIMHGYSFDIGGENKPYMHIDMQELRLNTVMRATTMDVRLDIKNFKIEDKLVQGSCFPNIVECAGVHVNLVQPPTGVGKLTLRTEKTKVVANIECLLGIAGEMVRATSGLVDMKAISKGASSRSEKYINAGKNYMAKAIAGKYERHPLELDLKLEAPCFIVPLDLRSPRDILVIDLGQIKSSTTIAPDQNPSVDTSQLMDKDQMYDRYKFYLESARIYTESSDDTEQTAIFEPKKVDVNVGMCVNPRHPQLPAIEFYITNEDVPLRFSDTQLFLLLRIKEKIMEEMAENMPARAASKEDSETIAELERKKTAVESAKLETQEKATVICQHFYILFQKFTIDLYSKGGHVFTFSMLNSLLVVTMTPEGSIVLDYKLDEIFAFDKRPGVYWNRILGDPIMQRTKQEEIGEGKHYLSHIRQQYVRELHNAESEQFPAKDCDFFIRLVVLNGGSTIQGVVRLGEMCVTVNPDSLQTLMDIPQEAFRMLAVSKPVVPQPPPSPRSAMIKRAATILSHTKECQIASYTTSSMAVDMQILVDCAELRLPLDSHREDSKIFSFYVETDMLYRADEEYRYGKTMAGKVSLTEPIRVEKEVRIDVYKVGMIIGYGTEDSGIKGKDREKGDLVKPCRLNMNYSQEWVEAEQFMRNIVEMNLETFELVVGFRDLDFFKALGKTWAKPQQPQPQSLNASSPQAPPPPAAPKPEQKPIASELRLDFKTECLQLDLCDDTRNTLIPLTRSQVGNMSAQMVFSDKEFTLSFAGSTETSYYNSLVASWEPLLEFWTFELVASPHALKEETKEEKKQEEGKEPEEQTRKEYLQFEGIHPLYLQFKSMSPFRVNVTYSMVQTLAVMMKTMGEDSSTWGPEKQTIGAEERGMLEASKLVYKLKNRTGQPLNVRVDGNTVEGGLFNLAPGASQELSQQVFEKAAGRTLSLQRYNSLLQAPQTPSTLSLDLACGTAVSGIAIDKIGLYAYRVEGFTLVVEIIPEISHISVVLESGYKVVNNSPEDVVLRVQGTEDRLTVISGHAEALPVAWTKEVEKVVLVTAFEEQKIPAWQPEPDSPHEDESPATARLSATTYVVLDSLKLVSKTPQLSQSLLLLNPPMRVLNYLPTPLIIHINDEAADPPARVDPGEETCLFSIDPRQHNKFKWVMDLGAKDDRALKLWTDFVKIEHSEDQHYKLEGDIPCDKLSINNKRKAKYNTSADCDIMFRKCEDERLYGQLIAVYNQYWIVNHTDFPLEFTGKKDYLKIAPHTIGMVKCKQSSLTVRLSDAEGGYGVASEFSQKFNITTTGVAGLIKLDNPESVTKQGKPNEVNLGLLIEAGKKPIIKSTIIHLYPRYIITNKTSGTLYVRQHNCTVVEQLGSMAVCPYQFENGKLPKFVQISADKESWSSAFSLDEIEDFQVRFVAPESLRNNEGKWWQASQANGNMLYTRVVVSTETEATLFVTLLEPVDPEILIKNESNSPLSISQVNTPFVLNLTPHSTLPFAYDNRLLPVKKVLFKTFSAERMYVLDKMKDSQKPLGDLTVSVEPDLSSRVVIVREKSENSDSSGEMRLIASEGRFSNISMTVLLPGFELSLHDEVPAERFLLTVLNIKLKVKMSDGSKKEAGNKEGVMAIRHATQLAVKLGIQHIQLDNMSSGSSEFPIIFGGTDPIAASPMPVNADSSAPVTPFIQVGIIKDHIETLRSLPNSDPVVTSAFDRFSFINVTIQEMQAKVHQDTVMGLLAVVAKLQSGFAENPQLARKISRHNEFGLERTSPSLRADSPALSYDPGTVASKAYLSALQMNALKIILSFKTGRKQELDLDPRRGFGMLGLLSRIGGAFITITDSTLHFSSVIICDSFQTMGGIIGLVVKNYVKQGILQFYRILGSSDLIGNPIGLIDKLGTGVFEFFSEPVKGLMKASPKEFTKGVGKGVKSLVTSVVSGGFGSVSKITGSLYTVVREVGGDEESANRINSTDNVAAGVYDGVKGGIVDLTEGMTGIFTKPWHGAKRGGVSGFLKGVSSGVVGAVTAPLSAVLRVSTSVTASVVAQTLLLDDKLKQAGRMRFARQFGARKVLEAYNHPLAQAQFVLLSSKDFTGEELVYYGRLAPREHVIVTQNNLFYVQRFEICAYISLRSLDIVKVERLMKAKKGVGFRLVATAPGQTVVIPCDNYQHLAKLYKALAVVRKILRLTPTTAASPLKLGV